MFHRSTWRAGPCTATWAAAWVAVLLSCGPAAAQTPDARRLNDSANITGEVSAGPRTLKHHLRITYRQAPPQELLIEAASETVFANMQAAYAAFRNKDSASKDFAQVVSPTGWVLVIYWPEVVALQRWSDKP